jgi:hypothetical protein
MCCHLSNFLNKWLSRSPLHVGRLDHGSHAAGWRSYIPPSVIPPCPSLNVKRALVTELSLYASRFLSFENSAIRSIDVSTIRPFYNSTIRRFYLNFPPLNGCKQPDPRTLHSATAISSTLHRFKSLVYSTSLTCLGLPLSSRQSDDGWPPCNGDRW